MDWERAAKRPLSRRRILQAATFGTAAMALAACGGTSNRPVTPATATPPARPSSTSGGASPSPSATATGTTPARSTLRYAGLVIDDGTWDPHKTQAGAVTGQQAMVFSRLLSYSSQGDGTLVTDLAREMPEQVDARTMIFRLHQAAHWHDRSPVNGREITSQDVKFSIERQRDGDPSFVHKARWQNIELIEALEPSLLRITLAQPLTTALPSFASLEAFIVPPEASPDGASIGIDGQAGSGPFRWVEWQTGEFASVARNPDWFASRELPLLDGIDLLQPRDNEQAEAYLRVKKLDAAMVSRPTADRLRASIPELVEKTAGTATFFGMRFYTPQFPYNDPRFRKAVSIVLDRRAMIEQFFSGSGRASSWVSWPMTHWALPEDELANIAGHRPGESGRQQDVAEAVALLSAFASTQAIPEDNALFVIDEAEAAVGIGSFIRDQLKGALNLNVTVYPVTISEFVNRLFRQEAPWAAGPDTGSIDLDDWVYPYFHSAGVKNTMAFRSPDFDALIESQRVQFDSAQRQATGFEIQRQLLELSAAVNFVSEELVSLTWPYVDGFPLDAIDGYQDRFASTSIDVEHPAIRGRA